MILQVQKQLQQQRQEVERELQMMERSIGAALLVEAGQQVTDEPKKHKDVLAPSGQNVSTPFRGRATKVGII